MIKTACICLKIRICNVKIKKKDYTVMNFNVVLHKEENGYWAEVPALKGCFTQGDSIEEVRENIKEAIKAWLSVDLRDVDGEVISVAL